MTCKLEPQPGVGLARLVSHLDLFSGIGGFALAAQMVGGIETMAFCEREPYAQRVLRKHWPEVPICNDIYELKGTEYGTIDIITGGFPCQPFSIAGRRGGTADDRALWPQMLRVISDARPTWVLGENVIGLASLGLDNVLADLEAQGYACTTLSIPAVALNARQVRHRLWIVAHARCQHGDGRTDLRSACDGFGKMHEDWEKAKPDLCGWLQKAWDTDDMRERGNRHGLSSGMDRAMRLKAIGNAIVPQIAAEIIRAMMRVDCMANAPAQPRRAGEVNPKINDTPASAGAAG